MKNYYIRKDKLHKYLGGKKASNMREDFVFGRDCICIGQTEQARWWTSETAFIWYNADIGKGNNGN